MEQVGVAITGGASSPASSLSSSISSIAPGSLARQQSMTDTRPLSFTTRRRRERATTMYPELEGGGSSINSNGLILARSPFENLRKSGTNLSRSVSVSTSPSASYSPAYQYLSRYGSVSGQGSGGGAQDGYLGEQIGNYVLGKLIGYGAFSQIREAVTFEHGQKVIRAVKIVRKHSNSQTTEKMEQVQAEFDHEMTLWRNLNHENILHLLEVEEDSNAIYCFTDKISSGTLLDVVRNIRTKFHGADEEERAAVAKQLLPKTLDYARQLCAALVYLHQTMHVVHRDFKLENCLMEQESDSRYRVLVCDFGMSDYYEEEISPATSGGVSSDERMADEPGAAGADNGLLGPRTQDHSNSSASISSARSDSSSNHLLIGPSDTSSRIHLPEEEMDISRAPSSISLSTNTSQNGGSLPYAPPQLLKSNTPIVSPSTDIWALGVVLHALLMGKLPWHHGFAPKLRMMILDANWDDAAMEKLYGKKITDIVRGCLTVDVESRWDIGRVRGAVDQLVAECGVTSQRG